MRRGPALRNPQRGKEWRIGFSLSWTNHRLVQWRSQSPLGPGIWREAQCISSSAARMSGLKQRTCLDYQK